MDLERVKDSGGNSYKKYESAGGAINEKDYMRALTLAKNKKVIDSHRLIQAQGMAIFAGITLNLKDSGEGIDPRVALYEVLVELRADENPESKEINPFGPMSDQKLFAEELRMLGDTESLAKFLAKYPHIFPKGE